MSPTWMTPYEIEVGERFANDVAEHEMQVLFENGLYRHLRFRRPERSSYWFDLVTWPGNLVIKGDMGSFTFSRLDDMFQFFRRKGGWRPVDTINPSYWAEKTPHRTVTEEYSEEKFRRVLADEVAQQEGDYPGLGKAVADQILDPFNADVTCEEGARSALDLFHFYPNGDEFGFPFRFSDTWEWDFKDWSYHYLWCCNAIQWGITQYDKARTPAGAVSAA